MYKNRKKLVEIIRVVSVLTLCIAGLSACGRQSISKQDTATTAEFAATENNSQEAAASDLVITAVKGGAADSFVLLSENHVAVIDTGLDDKAKKLLEFLEEQGAGCQERRTNLSAPRGRPVPASKHSLAGG